METVINKEKKELRQQLLHWLASLTEHEIKRRSKDVQTQLERLPFYRKAKTIAAYYPLRGEVDIVDLMRKAIGQKRFCFPVSDARGKRLRFFEVANFDDDFVQGPFGIMEPDTKKTKEVDIKEIDMVIVPGLAFDQKRNRLGRGGGFYDRFLPTRPPFAIAIGITFESQVLESLPVDLAFDRQVDHIITEQRII